MTDKTRFQLLSLLSDYDLEDRINEVIPYFQCETSLEELSFAAILEKIDEEGMDSCETFQLLQGKSDNFYKYLIDRLMAMDYPSATWLLGSLAESQEYEISSKAIRALGCKNSSTAYEILENLSGSPEREKVRLEAMDSLRQSGVAKPAHRVFVPYKYYLSWIDGSGDKVLIISQRCGRVQLSMASFTLHENEGIIDCSCWNDISNYEMEPVIKSLEQDVGLQEIHHNLAISMLEDSLAWTLQKQKIVPPSFLAVRQILGKQKLYPRFYDVDLKSISKRFSSKDIQENLESSTVLLEQEPFCGWFVINKAVINFIQDRKSLLQGQKIRKGTLNQFIKTVFDEEKELWIRRFLLTADFMSKISPRSYREAIDICYSIAISLQQDISMTAIPVMVSLAELSIQNSRQIIQEESSSS